jgi:antitoxin YefM
MKTATITDFRRNIKKHLAKVDSDKDILIVSAPEKKDFVVLTLEMFNSMEETAYLLSTPANTDRLMRGIADHKSGRVVVKNIDEYLQVAEQKQTPKRASSSKPTVKSARKKKQA